MNTHRLLIFTLLFLICAMIDNVGRDKTVLEWHKLVAPADILPEVQTLHNTTMKAGTSCDERITHNLHDHPCDCEGEELKLGLTVTPVTLPLNDCKRNFPLDPMIIAWEKRAKLEEKRKKEDAILIEQHVAGFSFWSLLNRLGDGGDGDNDDNIEDDDGGGGGGGGNAGEEDVSEHSEHGGGSEGAADAAIGGDDSLDNHNPRLRRHGASRRKEGRKIDFDKKIKVPAYLQVKVIDAFNLQVKDANGRSDPFVVLQVGEQQSRTTTDLGTLRGQYNKEFKFLVDDVWDVLDVWVFDEDALRKQEFLGRTRIPLLRLPNGQIVDANYVLKTDDLSKPVMGGGEVHLKLKFEYNKWSPKTYTQLTERKLPRLEDFRKRTFKYQICLEEITRLQRHGEWIVAWGKKVDMTISWNCCNVDEQGISHPTHWPSTFLLAMLTLVLLFGSARDILLAYVGALYAAKPNNFDLSKLDVPPQEFTKADTNNSGESDWSNSSDEDQVYLDSSDESDEEQKESEVRKALRKLDPRKAFKKLKEYQQQLQSLKRMLYTVQKTIKMLADTVEKVQQLHNWSAPLITTLYGGVLCILVVATHAIGLANLVLAGVWFKMGKGWLRRYGFGWRFQPKFKVGFNSGKTADMARLQYEEGGEVKPLVAKHDKHRIDHNPVVDLMGRVPTLENLEECKRFKPLDNDRLTGEKAKAE
jgi:hypothetical protein